MTESNGTGHTSFTEQWQNGKETIGYVKPPPWAGSTLKLPTKQEAFLCYFIILRVLHTTYTCSWLCLCTHGVAFAVSLRVGDSRRLRFGCAGGTGSWTRFGSSIWDNQTKQYEHVEEGTELKEGAVEASHAGPRSRAQAI
uniref:Uncharacterized protein n=1 Tax=Eutreptiella gymnastica TaxID=73025 RepID=A0A7S4G7Q4_9EUGL